ncbi:MAG: addiction module toxin RelE [Proteobacteria bacterium SG_bin7]|nr:MAG: addiction module toxin RelE [Proteobacteria bacterium SG_bin7]
MASYKIEFSSSARKELKKLPKPYIKNIVAAIDELATSPFPSGVKKLVGEELYRIRVGPYRILYEVEGKALLILIIKIGHRKDVYR